jgi:hypothetical protein
MIQTFVYFVILDDFWLPTAQFCDKTIHVSKFDSHVHITHPCASSKIINCAGPYFEGNVFATNSNVEQACYLS